MSSLPIKASSFASVIREVIKVRTKGAFAGVNVLLLAIVFTTLMIFGSSVTTNQTWLIIAFLVVWQGFAVFAMFNLPSQENIEIKKPE